MHALPEANPIRRLDDKMHVVLLNRKVEDAMATPHGVRDLALHDSKNDLRTQAGRPRHRMERDVNRMVLVVRGTRDVRHEADAIRVRRPTRAWSSAAVFAEWQLLLARTTARHLELA